jgi:hypothetical protein
MFQSERDARVHIAELIAWDLTGPQRIRIPTRQQL